MPSRLDLLGPGIIAGLDDFGANLVAGQREKFKILEARRLARAQAEAQAAQDAAKAAIGLRKRNDAINQRVGGLFERHTTQQNPPAARDGGLLAPPSLAPPAAGVPPAAGAPGLPAPAPVVPGAAKKGKLPTRGRNLAEAAGEIDEQEIKRYVANARAEYSDPEDQARAERNMRTRIAIYNRQVKAAEAAAAKPEVKVRPLPRDPRAEKAVALGESLPGGRENPENNLVLSLPESANFPKAMRPLISNAPDDALTYTKSDGLVLRMRTPGKDGVQLGSLPVGKQGAAALEKLRGLDQLEFNRLVHAMQRMDKPTAKAAIAKLAENIDGYAEEEAKQREAGAMRPTDIAQIQATKDGPVVATGVGPVDMASFVVPHGPGDVGNLDLYAAVKQALNQGPAGTQAVLQLMRELEGSRNRLDLSQAVDNFGQAYQAARQP